MSFFHAIPSPESKIQLSQAELPPMAQAAAFILLLHLDLNSFSVHAYSQTPIPFFFTFTWTTSAPIAIIRRLTLAGGACELAGVILHRLGIGASDFELVNLLDDLFRSNN